MAEAKTTSVFDMPSDPTLEARMDAEAEADYAAGRVVPNEKVRVWLASLAHGERLPPPQA